MCFDKERALLGIAFSMTKGTNAALAKAMEEKDVSVDDFFSFAESRLINILDLNSRCKIDFSGRDAAIERAREEVKFVERHSIKTLFINDSCYPYRLRQLEDAPTVLYAIGGTELNAKHIIAFVGTRNATPYGMNFCKKSVTEIQHLVEDTVVVSGLAYGIDSCAHSASVSAARPTVAVVAHGLDMIYPSANRGLAHDIIKNGGAIVSEYYHGEKPFKQRFLQRNRIIAGLCDGVVIVESGIKGGAMSTANIAFSESRDVMALPGRINDEKSEGCNYLIKKQKAQLVASPSDIIETMFWDDALRHIDAVQMSIFPELDQTQQLIFKSLKGKNNPVSVDNICVATNIPVGQLIAALSEMEFEGIIVKYPGNRYLLA